MFMCFVNWSSVVNLDLFCKQIFSYTIVLALATLGSATHNESFLLTKASTVMTVGCYYHWCFANVQKPLHSCKSLTRESLLKGTNQYSWPPCSSSFSLATFDTETLFFFISKQTILMRRSTVLSFPLQLVFPGLTLGKKARDCIRNTSLFS
jgi:hypothetical protein